MLTRAGTLCMMGGVVYASKADVHNLMLERCYFTWLQLCLLDEYIQKVLKQFIQLSLWQDQEGSKNLYTKPT